MSNIIVNLKNYNSYFYILSKDCRSNFWNLWEPQINSSNMSYTYLDEEFNIYFIDPKYYYHPRSIPEIVDFTIYRRILEDYEIKLNYFSSNNKLSNNAIKIPYEYYSKAFIDFYDLAIQDGLREINNIDISKSIICSIDSLGRLYIDKESIWQYIIANELKLPYIEITIKDINHTLSDISCVDLANKYLFPYFIINPPYNNPLDFFSNPDTIARKYLESCSSRLFNWYVTRFLATKQDIENSKELFNGYIFEDGSYLFFTKSYHEQFNYLISKENILEKELTSWIKFSSARGKGHTVVYSSNANYSKEALRQLKKFKKRFYFDEDIIS